jgi:hypothetical protein
MIGRSFAFAATVFGLALFTAAVAADNPFAGTWKLNVAKSMFAGPAPQSETIKIEGLPNGQKVVGDFVNPDGKTIHSEFTATYDGKDHPVSGRPTMDATALQRVDINTIISTSKKDGKVALTTKWVVSKDGKTMIGSEAGRNAQGQEIHRSLVFERQ